MSSGGKVNSNFDMDMGPVDVDMEGQLKYLQYTFFLLNQHFCALSCTRFCFRKILKIHKENEKIREYYVIVLNARRENAHR